MLTVRLDRDEQTLELDVKVVAQLPARTEGIRFNRVSELELYGFNEQNVLFDLKANRASDGLWDVTLQSSYGLGGSFRCASIERLPP